MKGIHEAKIFLVDDENEHLLEHAKVWSTFGYAERAMHKIGYYDWHVMPIIYKDLTPLSGQPYFIPAWGLYYPYGEEILTKKLYLKLMKGIKKEENDNNLKGLHKCQ